MKTMSKSADWYIGTRVRHNFSHEMGMILEHQDDPRGYNWLVRFDDENGQFLKEDWYKEEVLEEYNA